MTSLATILAPSINWSGPTSTADKRVWLLEDLLPGFVLPASPWSIKRLTLWDQPLGEYPATCSGRISVGVDPCRRYLGQSGFPVVEKCEPQTLKMLGRLEFGPGRAKSIIQDHPLAITYTPGLDAIVIVPEMAAPVGWPSSIFLGFGIEAPDFVPETGTVFSSALDKDAGGQPAYCFRSLIPGIGAGGSQVRVRVSSRASGCTITHASIGVQASGPTMAAAPAPLTFGGVAALNLAPWSRVWSDWANLTTVAGQSLLVNTSLFNASNALSYRDSTVTTGGGCSWWSWTDSWNVASMASPTVQPGGQRCVDAVQVM